MKTVRLTVGQAVVKYLSAQYSERDGKRRRLIPGMFGIFGHGNVSGIGQGLIEYGKDLPYFQTRNEQNMVHIAAGFAKATRRMATFACSASIGPGSTNMITGAALASINRLPVLLLPSDYYSRRAQGPVLQQLEHPLCGDESVNDCFRPVSRFFDRVTRPEHLLTALPEAMRVLTDPAETGSVTIALPQDIQSHAYDFPAHLFEEHTWRIERRPPNLERIREAMALLRAAKRPLIIAGGGVMYSDAQRELQAFADKSGIPLAETSAGKGALQTDNGLLLGGAGGNGTGAAAAIMTKADLVICVGTRLTDFTTASQSAFQNPNVKFIGINVCGHDAFKQGALPVLADAREALRALARATRVKTSPAYRKEVTRAKAAWLKTLVREGFSSKSGTALGMGQIIHTLNQEAKAGDTIVAAAGLPPGDLLKAWDATGGRAAHLEFGYSCMTYEIPASIGVRMAQPKGEVIVFIGDGTYLMNPTEIVTAVQEGKKITVVIAENHGFQSIRGLQMLRVGRSFGNEFRARDARKNRLEGAYLALDLAQNAASLGARTWRAKTEDGLAQALRTARRETRPCVIVVETEKHWYLPPAGLWMEFEPAEVTNDPITRKVRKEYEKVRRKVQRFHH